MDIYSKEIFDSREKGEIIKGFREWIELQNYVVETVKSASERMDEFIQWCIEEKVKDDHARHFFNYQKKRANKLKPGGLSVSYLRKYLSELRMFRRYLREVLDYELPINIIYKEVEVNHNTILSTAEIKAIYQVIDDDFLGLRDLAMMGVYYGCGLRRNEGASLIVDDILPDKNLIYVRKGKNYKERYVPMIGRAREDILLYLRIGRPGLLKQYYEPWLFIGITGKRLSGYALYDRFKKLVKKARIEKNVGLHSLRHSLATHLLQNGMSLKQIGKLLGHATLDTTQIYTHILDDINYGSREDL